jgi:uncharacterized membrane protein YgdD (TMEM256/DUF423 family)
MTNRLFIKLAAYSVGLSIILGAFGAHALKDHFSASNLEIWNKGIFYQLVNSIGIICLIILEKVDYINKVKFCCSLLTIGILFFSGSLYTIALMKTFFTDITIVNKIMIPITPLGGSLLIIGWLLVPFKVK